ncbi:glycosyltransferase [uncultured Cetobacterium sp.]|uniref:glycosyltransferase n=1 Tax=uncultured Cetobacterium sp. TaxID=527638 RepID=UPI00260B5153|nr:glycosyltransferase [uncultured Cetobacterium sp.]
MKILHIITSLELGGAEKLLLDLIPSQKKQGVEVELLVLDTKNQVFLEDFKKRGIKVNITKINNKKSFKNIFEIVKLIKKEKFDVVHAHLIHSQIWTSLAKRMVKNVEFITTEHSTSNNRRKKSIYKILDKMIYSSYDKVVAISEGTAESLVKWIGISMKKLEIIENGVSLRAFMGRSKERKGDKLIMVSRFHESKDHLTVLRALKKLSKNYTLTFVGEGETQDKVLNEAKMLKLEERVSFLGYSNSISSLLKRHDIAIQSSNYEGFGISALEAMASGTPLIGSDVKGLAEVIKGGGLLFQLGNENDLVDKILLLEDKAYYLQKSKDGIKNSLQYSIENTAKKYIALYKGE